VHPVRREHLETDEREQGPRGRPEVAEPPHRARQDEVQGPKAQDGQGIRRERHERVPGDGQDGRDGVDGEHEVAGLDDQQDRQQGRGQAPAVLADAEALATKPIGHWQDPPDDSHGQGVFDRTKPFRSPNEPDGREEQDPTEDEDHPVEPLQQGSASQDEPEPQADRPDHTPEQHPVLMFGGNGEVGEDQDEHENVVHRQAPLDEVAGQELARALAAQPGPHQTGEPGSHGHPDRRPGQRLAERHEVAPTMGHSQIKGQEDDDGGEECRPVVPLDHVNPTSSPTSGRRSRPRPSRWTAAQPGRDTIPSVMTVSREWTTPLQAPRV
jgi:hypothetical protein